MGPRVHIMIIYHGDLATSNWTGLIAVGPEFVCVAGSALTL